MLEGGSRDQNKALQWSTVQRFIACIVELVYAIRLAIE